MFIKVYIFFLSFLPPQLSGEQQLGGSGVQLSASVVIPKHWAPPFDGSGEVHVLLLDLDVAPQQLHAPQDDHPPSTSGALNRAGHPRVDETNKMINRMVYMSTKWKKDCEY